jgi:hypothetical protein
MNSRSAALFAIVVGVGLCSASLPASAQETALVMGSHAVEGAIDREYEATDHVVVKTDHGIRHVFSVTKRTLVHGTKDSLEGLHGGTRVVVHYVEDGGRETAVEVDRIGDDSFHVMRGTVSRFDADGKGLSIRLADGSVETFRLSERAASEAGKEIAHGGDSAGTVVVYYTDEAGEKVAHYVRTVA